MGSGSAIEKSHAPISAARAGSSASDACEVSGADPDRVRLGREHLLSAQEYGVLAETFRALSDASRARIVHSLLRQELCTCDLAAIAGISEPAVSQHLRYLKALHVVKSRREGKKVFYSLADAHVRFLLAVTLRHQAHSGADQAAPGGGAK